MAGLDPRLSGSLFAGTFPTKPTNYVMPGLDPGIHAVRARRCCTPNYGTTRIVRGWHNGVDARIKSGHDTFHRFPYNIAKTCEPDISGLDPAIHAVLFLPCLMRGFA